MKAKIDTLKASRQVEPFSNMVKADSNKISKKRRPYIGMLS